MLGKQTVAEFVESAAILEYLNDLKVDYVQGNYVDPPLMQVPGMTDEDIAMDSVPSGGLDFSDLPDLSELTEYKGDLADISTK